ncbi:MAG TPA: winged helix-turn-helix transcriptional regulator, partial [Polyangiaceae bacterium]|nr:winged helix-turn-helix transcriptional regulator [Polyangiaceae bacterium]
CRGPTTSRDLANALGLTPSRVEEALRRLELEGFVMRCRSESAVSPPRYVARRLLARIHAYTVQRLRREIEPVSQRDFMRFLLEWQHVTPAARLRGPQAVLRVIDQLQGFEAAAGAWEPELLRARIADYDPKWLDELCWSGELVWGRLAPARPARDEAQQRSQVTRSSLITLLRRADLDWLLAAARGSTAAREPVTHETARILDELSRRGALFSSELAHASGYSRRDVEDALWEGVALGRLTCDGFHAVRALVGASQEPHTAVPRLPIGFRKPGSSLPRGDGRWALLPDPTPSMDPDELAEAVAGQLLHRWGVLTIELIRQETTSLSIRDLISALRRLEARGLVRGGRFVSGFSGEQYALTEALETLRSVRKQALAEVEVRLSACDPLNLVGVVVPGARVPRLRGNWVLYRDGLPIDDRTGFAENGDAAHATRREYEL